MNPEAGDHVITADPREWHAVQAAARRSWEELPYLRRRYGERGWRFTLSDSGWIAALCALPPDAVRAQLAWLQELLIPRGMPSWILERHLDALHEELVATAPDARDSYAVLAAGASQLRDERTRVLSDASMRELDRAFDAAVATLPIAFPGMGLVLVAAVVDEANAYERAIDAVASWAADPATFPEEWCAAVDDCVRAARREVRRR